MWTSLFGAVDRLMRGAYTRTEDLEQGRIDVPERALVIASVCLGAIYGASLGFFGGLRGGSDGYWQLLAGTLKVPLLFLLTLVVTFPSLYVFSALSGSRLFAIQTLRLLLAAITVNLAVLASFGPVTGFFTLSTKSYPFMVVLNVIFFAIAGFVGVGFLRRTLRSVFGADASHKRPPVAARPASTDAAQPAVVAAPGPVQRYERGLVVLRIWIVIYAVVGAQMGWILRPFVGSPDLPFTLFRNRESNFFAALLRALGKLFS